MRGKWPGYGIDWLQRAFLGLDAYTQTVAHHATDVFINLNLKLNRANATCAEIAPHKSTRTHTRTHSANKVALKDEPTT